MTAVAMVLIILGGFIALANWWSIYLSYRTGRFRSAIPLVGAALLLTGMTLLPVTRPFCWIAIFLDYGTLVILLAAPVVVREIWRTSWFNLEREYVGKSGRKSVRLRLFRQSVFVIRLEINRPLGEVGLVGGGTTGIWTRDGVKLILDTSKEEASFEVIPGTLPESLRQTVGFPSWEKRTDHSLAGIDLVEKQQ